MARRVEPDQRTTKDAGAVLPLAMVMSVVITLVVIAVASYVFSGLKYAGVVEERADRLAAADGGLRYAIERLQNSSYAGCLSNLGNTGYTIAFPVDVNGAKVDITCKKGANGIGDIKAWAIIVTGQGVPSGGWFWSSQSGSGLNKLLGGPVWITDPGRADLQAPVKVEDGDIWYYSPDCSNSTLSLPANLTFSPAYRGPICVQSPWYEVYDAPQIAVLPWPWDASQTNQPPTMVGGCTVFKPGRYTTMPALGPNTYFQAGDYYFHNVTLDISFATVTAGWADFDTNGDQRFVANQPCDAAISADSTSGSSPGATLYLGGSSKIEIGTKGKLEVLRRLQGDSFVSIQAVDYTTIRMSRNTLGYENNIVWTKSGTNTDLAIHGLLWAPRAQLEFGNVTNAANGQLLGGAAVSRIVLQASASVSNFLIRVEPTPASFELRLDSTATLNGQATTMTAIVEIDDQGTTAVRSWRVRD